MPAALLLVGCSSSPGKGGDGGHGGTAIGGATGQGGKGGGAGTSGGAGTTGGAGGKGGSAGAPLGGAGGKGGSAGEPSGGTGGGGGSAGAPGGGRGGGAGIAGLPACVTGAPTFSVCAVSNADVLPLPNGSGGGSGSKDAVVAAAATVEAVGTGAAPFQCQSARLFGAAAASDWWVQVRTADTKLWTIGLHGFADPPAVQIGDHVTLDVQIQRSLSLSSRLNPKPISTGFVQLSNAAGTPLVWAGNDIFMAASWLSLATGEPVCGWHAGSCDLSRYEVSATVNGSTATMMPFSATHLGGYDLAIGDDSIRTSKNSGNTSACDYDGPPQFAAAAVKTP